MPLVRGADNEVLRAFYKRITGFDETNPWIFSIIGLAYTDCAN